MKIEWLHPSYQQPRGIVVASDATQQWLLPWWWEHYSRFNSFPVLFVDLGMTQQMKTWCQEKGSYCFLPLSDIFVVEKEEIEPCVAGTLEEKFGTHFWPKRSAWFRKPFACLSSPFQHSLWIDLDCEVRGSLEPLFSFPSLAMSSQHFEHYNTGVILFKHRCSVIEEWALRSLQQNQFFAGDQDLFNALLEEQSLPIHAIPAIYNWSRLYKESSEIVIMHWHGPQGKAIIAHHITRVTLTS